MAYHAAYWIAFVRVATASSISTLVFSGIDKLIRLSIVSRKTSQSICLLYKDGFFGVRRT